MARIRNASSNSALNPRKRGLESADPSPSSKRLRELPPASARWISTPGKNKVHFGKGSRIISGPSIMDPERRSQSPTRSALRRPLPEDDHGQFDVDDEHHGPSAQLQDDLCRAESPVRTYRPTKVSGNPVSRFANANTKSKATKPATRPLFGTDGDDADICKNIDGLKTQIREFAESFPARAKKAKSDILSQLIQPQNEQAVRYIGCIALAGGNGAQAWQELLTDEYARKSVVWGVLGKALKENVFDELYFGAWPELELKLREMEREQARQDGFYRQRSRSDKIGKQEAGRSRAEIDSALHKDTARVALGLETILLPLWCLGDKASEDTWAAACMHKTLFEIVLSAGDLARTMRRSRDVIYYWPPTLKDEEFEPARMECINLGDMIRNSPYDRGDVQGRDRPVLREGHKNESQAIVRVVCFPGIQAFRQGGGDLAKKQLDAGRSGRNLNNDAAPPDVVAMRRRITNRYGEEYTGNEGIRTRIISKGVVLLQWGQQRLLTKEAGTSIHIDAMKNGKMQKYADDMGGHIELYTLFRQRMGPSSPAKSSPQREQRSPSFFERFVPSIGGMLRVTDPEQEEEIADFTRRHQQRMEEKKRALVGVPSAPKSRKGSKR